MLWLPANPAHHPTGDDRPEFTQHPPATFWTRPLCNSSRPMQSRLIPSQTRPKDAHTPYELCQPFRSKSDALQLNLGPRNGDRSVLLLLLAKWKTRQLPDRPVCYRTLDKRRRVDPFLRSGAVSIKTDRIRSIGQSAIPYSGSGSSEGSCPGKEPRWRSFAAASSTALSSSSVLSV